MPISTQPEIARDTDYRVRLRNSTAPREAVTFISTPDVIEARSVSYDMVEPVHAPGQIMAYMRTSSRTYNISNAMLISRTPEEAKRNLQYLWILRSWTMPTFGKSSLTEENRLRRRQFENIQEFAQQNQQTLDEDVTQIFSSLSGVENRGRPPAVLLLSAYSRDSSAANTVGGRNSQQEHINRVPVVIQNISIPYPSDVDYIPTPEGVPMPTIMSIEIQLIETHSPREYEQFDLKSFRRGTLAGF